eukprot:765928-Hanusia_phi.AAC.3
MARRKVKVHIPEVEEDEEGKSKKMIRMQEIQPEVEKEMHMLSNTNEKCAASNLQALATSSTSSFSNSPPSTLKKCCEFQAGDIEADGQVYARVCPTCHIPSPRKIPAEKMKVLRRNSCCASASLVRLESIDKVNVDSPHLYHSTDCSPNQMTFRTVNRSYCITVIPAAHIPRNIFSVMNKDRWNTLKSRCVYNNRALEIVVLIHSQSISDKVRHFVCIQPQKKVRDLCHHLIDQIIAQRHHNPIVDIPEHGPTTDFVLMSSRKCADKPLNSKLNMDFTVGSMIKESDLQDKHERITLHAYKPQEQSQMSQILGNMSEELERLSLNDVHEC